LGIDSQKLMSANFHLIPYLNAEPETKPALLKNYGKKRILWQLFPSYLLITFTALLAVGGYASSSLRDFYYDRTAEDLKARAWLIERQKELIMNKKLAIILLVLFWTGSAFGGNIEVDPQLSNYNKQGGVSGNVSSVGSDTLNNLMTLWNEKLKQFYPNINIQVEGKGSSTAPPTLIFATAQLGPMSRAMKQKK
jgi:hypothetical protein